MKDEPSQADLEARVDRTAYAGRSSIRQLERDRAALVRLYRQNPHAWPDGIDHPGNPWYRGHESEW